MKHLSHVTAVAISIALPASGDDMSLAFQLPGFGGSPGSATYYLNQLESQKLDFTEEQSSRELESFEDQLERRVLAAVSSQIVGNIYGSDFTGDQVVEVGDLLITYSDVPDVNGNICVTIFDGVSSSNVYLQAP